MLFTVELEKSIEHGVEEFEVQLWLDKDGLKELLLELSHLQEHCDQRHLFTDSWGNGPLTENKYIQTNILVNHLRITLIEG